MSFTTQSFQHQQSDENSARLCHDMSTDATDKTGGSIWRQRLVCCSLMLSTLSLAYCFVVFTKASEACYVTPCYEGAGWQTLWMVNRGVTVAGTSSGIFFLIHAMLGYSLFRRRQDDDQQSTAADEFLQEAHFVVGIFAGCTLCASLLSANMVWIWGAERNLIHNLEKINPNNEVFDESGRHMTINGSLVSTFDTLTYISASVCLLQVLLGTSLLLARNSFSKYFRLLGGQPISSNTQSSSQMYNDEMIPLNTSNPSTAGNRSGSGSRNQRSPRSSVTMNTLLTIMSIGIATVSLVHPANAAPHVLNYPQSEISTIRGAQFIAGALRGGANPSSKSSSIISPKPFGKAPVQSPSRNNDKRALVDDNQSKRLQGMKQGLITVAITAMAYGLWDTRESWIGFFDKDKLQAQTLGALRGLQEGLPKPYSYTLYVIGMALWEAIGLSTIPVETAAGMVFGWNGVVLSGSGKLLGACLAFWLGKTALRDFVQQKLGDNTFLKLVKSSADDNPPLVACLIKFSCFPETIKNFGSSILSPPITLGMFAVATLFHGGMFSALWTYLGVDSAARLESTVPLPADPLLSTLMTLALINGIVISPLSMAYWVRTLQEKSNSTKRTKLQVFTRRNT
mmetsp:Transcript_273/g.658  ORF Transcript_273/g.658 Transcript_273/m.658 type:complete len:624 (-) Transcript_273:25-1896(-)